MSRALKPDVTVSIVDHKSGDMIYECLQSLFTSTSLVLEVIVVQNLRSESSRATEFPAVTVVRNEQVQGFSANHNQAIERGRGRYHLVLNDDTTLRPRALDSLVSFADAHPLAGVVGPKLIAPDGQEATPFRFPSALNELATALPRWLTPRSLRRHYGPEQCERAFQPDWIGGACMLLRREALDIVGLFDSRYFMFYEDADLCLRNRRAGWQVWYLPEAEVVHLRGHTTKRHFGKAWAQGQVYTSRLLYFALHRGRVQTTALRVGMILLDAAKYVKWQLLWRLHRSPERQSRWQLARMGIEAHLTTKS